MNLFKKGNKVFNNSFLNFYITYLENIDSEVGSIYSLITKEYSFVDIHSKSYELVRDNILDEMIKWWRGEAKPMDGKDFMNWVGKQIILSL